MLHNTPFILWSAIVSIGLFISWLLIRHHQEVKELAVRPIIIRRRRSSYRRNRER